MTHVYTISYDDGYDRSELVAVLLGPPGVDLDALEREWRARDKVGPYAGRQGEVNKFADWLACDKGFRFADSTNHTMG